MNLRKLYDKLLKSKRPIDFFGDAQSVDELKVIYKKYAKLVHPDAVCDVEKYIAGEAFAILNRLHSEGVDEINQGIYSVYDPLKLYKNQASLFELTIGGVKYKFYENVFEGEVASIFKGTSENDVVFLKVATDPADNELISNEYTVLSKLRHQSLPYVECDLMINDSKAILMREVKGNSLNELMEQYKKGVPQEHVMWMMERLLSVVGFLHSNCVVHGNIKPENIIINKDNHNVSLLGFSFCIPEANLPSSKYKIVNDYYTAPEVNKNARVLPASDIYSLGKIAIKLLGGDVASSGMPISADFRVRTFFRRMVSQNLASRPDDAWKLWNELKTLRTEVFGTKRFKKLD